MSQLKVIIVSQPVSPGPFQDDLTETISIASLNPATDANKVVLTGPDGKIDESLLDIGASGSVAQQALIDAEQAQTAATNALAAAAAAQGTANSATTIAVAAQNSANTALTNSAEAVYAASSATSIANLALSQVSSIVTSTAGDSSGGLVPVSWTTAPLFNAAEGISFAITLSGNVTGGVVENTTPGVLYTFIITQANSAPAGGYSFVWPDPMVGASEPGTMPGSQMVQSFFCLSDGTLLAAGPATYPGLVSQNPGNTRSTKTNLLGQFGGTVVVTSAVSTTFDASLGTSFQLNLQTNVTSCYFTNYVPGGIYSFLISQDAGAPSTGYTFVWPACMVDADAVSTKPGSETLQSFVCLKDGTMLPIGASVDSTTALNPGNAGNQAANLTYSSGVAYGALSRPVATATMSFDGFHANAYIVDLTVNVTSSSMVAYMPGVIYTFVVSQDISAPNGGFKFSWPKSCLGADPVSDTPGMQTIQNFICLSDGTLYAMGAASYIGLTSANPGNAGVGAGGSAGSGSGNGGTVGVVVVTSGTTVIFNGTTGDVFTLNLLNNVSSATFDGYTAGTLYTFVIRQDSSAPAAGFTFTWPGNAVGAANPQMPPGGQFVQTFVCLTGGTLLAISLPMLYQ
jgi:hypothetical protein